MLKFLTKNKTNLINNKQNKKLLFFPPKIYISENFREQTNIQWSLFLDFDDLI